jgi:D-xylose transport system substrate-binding protein
LASVVAATFAWSRPAAASAARGEAPRVALLLASMDADRYETDRDAFVARVVAAGGEALFASAGGDASRQEQQLAEQLARGVRAVVLQPVDPLRARRLVEAARRRHVPIVAYDRQVGTGAAAYVTHDHESLGRAQAQALVGMLPPQAHVVICMGEADSQVTKEITSANVATLRQAGVASIVAVPHAGWSADDCKATVLRALHEGRVDGVLANNGRMAVGAAEAVAAANGTGIIPVIGGDVTADSCRALRDGRLALDAVKPIAGLAAAAADLALALARGEALPSRPVEGGTPTLRLPVRMLRPDDARRGDCGGEP